MSTLDDAVEDIARLLRSMAPARVRTGVRAIDPRDLTELGVAERAAIVDAVHRRQVEFASGRCLVRSLIGAPTDLAITASGAPEWPRSVRGSLAHDRALVVAATTSSPSIRALGIDLEPFDETLDDDEADLVLRDDDRAPDPIAAFVMKEATYKTWSALGGRLLEHHDVRVDAEGPTFVATVVDDGTSFTGTIDTAGGRRLALVVAD